MYGLKLLVFKISVVTLNFLICCVVIYRKSFWNFFYLTVLLIEKRGAMCDTLANIKDAINIFVFRFL